jgi:hypothetical protein
MNTTPTKWIGIHVVCDDGHYWITDDRGNEEHCGSEFPSDARLEAFRNEVTR